MNENNTAFCDPDTDFECNSGIPKCIQRKSINDGIKDCLDNSDEEIENISCFNYAFNCLLFSNSSGERNSKHYNRCITLEMVRNGKNDCRI